MKNQPITFEASTILVEPKFDVEYHKDIIPGMNDFADSVEITITKVLLNGHDVTKMLTTDQLNEIQTNIEELDYDNPKFREREDEDRVSNFDYV